MDIRMLKGKQVFQFLSNMCYLAKENASSGALFRVGVMSSTPMKRLYTLNYGGHA
jgi:hypothetical protein